MKLYDVFYFTLSGKRENYFDSSTRLPQKAPLRRLAKCVCKNWDGQTVWLNGRGEQVAPPSWATK